jgi:hypothetical protein
MRKMENNFFNNNFEKLLKEKIDDFRMRPSKKTWHSIYNDLHPSKKWPSITISLFLAVALGLLSYLNTESYNKPTAIKHLPANKITAATSNELNKNTVAYLPTQHLFAKKNNINTTTINVSTNNNINKPAQLNIDKLNNNTPIFLEPIEKESLPNKLIDPELSIANKNEMLVAIFASNTKVKYQTTHLFLPHPPSLPARAGFSKGEGGDGLFSISPWSNKERETIFAKNDNIPKVIIPTFSDNDKAWIDNYALYNKPQKNIWKGRLFYEIYATPNISFRKLAVKTRYNFNGISDFEQLVHQQPALGIETGVSAIYPLTKNIRIKTGLQFNYTNYAVTAFETDHPVVTTLMMNDVNSDYSYLEQKISTVSNTLNQQSSKLHNTTYQASIPVGIEYKLAGKENLRWYASANIQPTYLFGGTAYLISSDAKNYVQDVSLMRKWNVNTALETFVSYKTSNDTRLQLGPQYRYQLFSTHKKYSVSENLYQLGIKFGVVKKF